MLLFTAFIVLFGWGRLLRGLAGAENLSIALTLASGLAALLVVGGILNLAHWAYPTAIDLLTLVGLLAALIPFRLGRIGRVPWRAADGVALAAMLGAGLFVQQHLNPQKIFNHGDDFERYFTYPVRMLATGTIGGNPLGSTGVDTLGGQAFLQAFVLRHLPIEHIAFVEWGAGLLLCLALTACATPGWRGAVLTGSAALALLSIDPEVVNVTSVYSTAALILAACLLSRRLFEPNPDRAPFVLLGVIYAGLVALKNTNWVFAAAHFGSVIVLSAPPSGGRPRRWGWTLGAAVAGALPWVLIHIAAYVRIIAAPMSVPSKYEAYGSLGSLLSGATTFYGPPYRCFTLTTMGMLALSLAEAPEIWKRRRPMAPGASAGLAAALAGVVGCAALLGFGWPTVGLRDAVRYCSPILIGTVPAVIVLFGGAPLPDRPRRLRVAPALLGLAVLVLFYPWSRKRIGRMAREGSPLAYLQPSWAAGEAAYDRAFLGGEAQSVYRRLQAFIPAGEPMIVWTHTPFLLDYRRNPIFDTDGRGLALAGMRFPAASYLLVEQGGALQLDVNSVQARMKFPGAADRAAAAATLAFDGIFQQWQARSDVLVQNWQFTLLHRREEKASAAVSPEQIAVERIKARLSAQGYWLTEYTPSEHYEHPQPEVNNYLTALMVDTLAPVAAAAGLEQTLSRARRYLAEQIGADGLVRYYVGVPITPDSDDTALVWRVAGGGKEALLPGLLRTLRSYRTPDGLYGTWLASPDHFVNVDRGRSPVDVGVQVNLLLFLAKYDPPGARALLPPLQRAAARNQSWGYYEKAPLLPLLRSGLVRQAGFDLELPASRWRKFVPGQEAWMEAARILAASPSAASAASSSPPARELLRALAARDFAEIRLHPPLLYNNDLTASISRYWWSEDFGYALWLRLRFAAH